MKGWIILTLLKINSSIRIPFVMGITCVKIHNNFHFFCSYVLRAWDGWSPLGWLLIGLSKRTELWSFFCAIFACDKRGIRCGNMKLKFTWAQLHRCTRFIWEDCFDGP